MSGFITVHLRCFDDRQVLQLIEEQIARVDQVIHALLLVGGFAGSEYLKQRVQDQFSSRIRVIARPPDADTATLRGAAAYGLARRPLVSSVIAPRSYLMKVKLPAEQEDWLKRPAYIKNNDAGVPICENRSVPSMLCPRFRRTDLAVDCSILFPKEQS